MSMYASSPPMPPRYVSFSDIAKHQQIEDRPVPVVDDNKGSVVDDNKHSSVVDDNKKRQPSHQERPDRLPSDQGRPDRLPSDQGRPIDYPWKALTLILLMVFLFLFRILYILSGFHVLASISMAILATLGTYLFLRFL